MSSSASAGPRPPYVYRMGLGLNCRRGGAWIWTGPKACGQVDMEGEEGAEEREASGEGARGVEEGGTFSIVCRSGVKIRHAASNSSPLKRGWGGGGGG